MKFKESRTMRREQDAVATMILDDVEKNGGDEAALVRWARARLGRAGPQTGRHGVLVPEVVVRGTNETTDAQKPIQGGLFGGE